MDLLAQNIFGLFSEQPNTFKLTRRALKFALAHGSLYQNVSVDKNIFGHFLKQPNSLNLTRTALKLAL